MPEFGSSPQETAGNIDALKFQDTKDKINLAYAERRNNPPEYEDYYSGVCDVDNPEAARAMADKLRESRRDPNRKMMIGVMTHPIMLDQDLPVPQELRDDFAKEFPSKEELAAAFTNDPDVMNTIHYADLYGSNGPRKGGESPNVLKNLELCVKYGGENLHAIQLDLTWPKADEIKMFKENHPDISIILQVGRHALNEAGNDPQKVADKLREYGDSIDFALLDMSMGKGRKMTKNDISELLRLFSLIQYELPNLGLVVAGGFGRKLNSEDSPEAVDPMEALKQIADEFPNISIDAQGGLKPDDAPKDNLGHYLATTPADPEKAGEYIRQASGILDDKREETDLTPRRNAASYIRT